MNRRSARLIAGALIAAVAASSPAGVALADAAAPSDWRSRIVSVVPENDAVRASIEGGSAFMRLVVERGHEVLVLGYDDEPYLRIAPSGDVFENRNSAATYYNTSTFGGEIPTDLDTSLDPEWSRIGGGGDWSWHDHRAHWMGDRPPPDLDPGESLPARVVPIVVDGVATKITVATTLVARPSWWPAIAGVLSGAVLAALATVRPRVGRGAASCAVAGAALLAGVVQFGSLPSATGPKLTWWLMPAIALVAALVSLAITKARRRSLLAHGLLLVADAQLLLWAWDRRKGLRRGVLPTDLTFTVDRWITATALAFGAVAVAVALFDIVRATIQPPAPTPSTAS